MRKRSRTRRRVLRGIVGGLTVGTFLNWLRPDPTTSPLEADGPQLGVETHSDPINETTTPYAVYQYASVAGELRPTLPINLVFPLDAATFDDVIGVFTAEHWYSRPSEYVRYAYNREDHSWTRSHWSGAGTVFGIAPRLHVRCWSFEGTASVQAHVDTVPSPGHRIASFEQATRGVARLFALNGWEVDPDTPEMMPLGNATAPDHAGEAIVIRR